MDDSRSTSSQVPDSDPASGGPTATPRSDLSLDALYARSDADREPLRVGVLLDGEVLPRFAARILEQIEASNFARLELAVFHDPPASEGAADPGRSRVGRALRVLRDPGRRKLLLFSLYARWDEERNAREDLPYAPVDCSDRLQGIPSLYVQPIVKGFTHRFPEEAVEQVRQRELDVILRFGFNILKGDILRAARFGVWSYHHGDNDHYRGGPPLFWEVSEDAPLSGVILQVLTEQLDAGQVLCKGLYATERGLSWARNRHQPYWGAADFVIRKLHELHQHGWEHVQARMVESRPYQGRRKLYRRPGNWEMCRFLVPRLLGKAASRLRPSRDAIGHWKLAVRTGGPALPDRARAGGARPDMAGFRWLESPPGHYHADPFLLQHRGRTWLFAEDYVHADKRGMIACAELGAEGDPAAFEPVLERPYHLSYPMVFVHGGDVFMIPESYDNGTVELYRARDFPRRWVLEKVLVRGHAVDTTAWVEGGRFWFFTTLLEPRSFASQLMLFSSEHLTGDWTSHPANPLSTDVRASRCAGAVFRRGGKLFRPSQDCSVRYGYSFSLNEVTRLDPDSYREERTLTVEPDWCRGLQASHTYAQCGSVEVVDGNHRVRARRSPAARP